MGSFPKPMSIFTSSEKTYHIKGVAEEEKHPTTKFLWEYLVGFISFPRHLEGRRL